MAVASLIVAILSLAVAIVAGIFAWSSIRRANTANQLSREANAIAKRTETRETERNDVVWEAEWHGNGVCRMVNAGRDEALSVHAVVAFDEERAEASAERIGSGEHLSLNLPGAQRLLIQEQESLEQASERGEADAFVSLHVFHERVTWQTPSGISRVHEDERVAEFRD